MITFNDIHFNRHKFMLFSIIYFIVTKTFLVKTTLAGNRQMDIRIMFMKKIGHMGLSAPASGLYTCI